VCVPPSVTTTTTAAVVLMGEGVQNVGSESQVKRVIVRMTTEENPWSGVESEREGIFGLDIQYPVSASGFGICIGAKGWSCAMDEVMHSYIHIHIHKFGPIFSRSSITRIE